MIELLKFSLQQKCGLPVRNIYEDNYNHIYPIVGEMLQFSSKNPYGEWIKCCWDKNGNYLNKEDHPYNLIVKNPINWSLEIEVSRFFDEHWEDFQILQKPNKFHVYGIKAKKEYKNYCIPDIYKFDEYNFRNKKKQKRKVISHYVVSYIKDGFIKNQIFKYVNKETKNKILYLNPIEITEIYK